MQSITRWIRPMCSGVLVALVSVHGAPFSALAAQDARRLVDFPADRRLVVTLGPVQGAATEGNSIAEATAGGRLVNAAMLHRFRVEVVDSAGRPARAKAGWRVSLFGGGADGRRGPVRSMVHLTNDVRDIAVPSPLGYPLDAADSLLVVASSRAGESETPLYLRIIIEYDAIDGFTGRLPIALQQVAAAQGIAEPTTHDVGTGKRSWEWTPAVGGRIAAIVGLPLDGMSKLMLEDTSTGEAVWHGLPVRGEAQTKHGAPILWLGVAVQAGRTYRLTVSYTTTTPASQEPALAIVMPTALRN